MVAIRIHFTYRKWIVIITRTLTCNHKLLMRWYLCRFSSRIMCSHNFKYIFIRLWLQIYCPIHHKCHQYTLFPFCVTLHHWVWELTPGTFYLREVLTLHISFKLFNLQFITLNCLQLYHYNTFQLRRWNRNLSPVTRTPWHTFAIRLI